MTLVEPMTPIKCSNCGKDTRIIHGDYRFSESGLKNVMLRGLELVHCDHCGSEDPVFHAMNSLMRAIALALINKPYRLAGEEVRFLRTYLGLTQEKFSRLLHIDKTTLSKWENNDDPVGTQSDLAIRMVVMAKDAALQPKLTEVVNQKLEQIRFTERRKGRRKYVPQRAKIEVNTTDLSYCYV